MGSYGDQCIERTLSTPITGRERTSDARSAPRSCPAASARERGGSAAEEDVVAREESESKPARVVVVDDRRRRRRRVCVSPEVGTALMISRGDATPREERSAARVVIAEDVIAVDAIAVDAVVRRRTWKRGTRAGGSARDDGSG
jgi:hypothetical protein